MALFYRQRKTGRIYHPHNKKTRNLNSDPDMFPVYGNIVDGIFIENDPRNDLIAQLQVMDDADEIKAFIDNRFNVSVVGNMPIVKIRALELVRRWEALVNRINDLTEDQVKNQFGDNDDPLVRSAMKDSDVADKPAEKEGPRAGYQDDIEVNEWNEAECKEYLKSEFKVDLRKLSHKGVGDLRDLVKDLQRHRNMSK